MVDQLPAGTVTLLFTDIEGSTKLWDEHRSAMAVALTRHNELLRAALENAGGVVVKDKGDGFFAAFHSVQGAVSACIAAQQQLAGSDWPEETGPPRVRMALHTGTIEPEDNDYRGPVVNRVARLESIANGGQILLSESSASLAKDSLPDGASLRDLGSHILRGMARASKIYQLCAPGLPTEFPPLRSESPGGVAMPEYRSSFVGRDEDVGRIAETFGAGARLVTLLGPGGIGKTRLAVESAASIDAEIAQQAYFADLAKLTDASDVGAAIARSVGAHPEGSASPVALAAERVAEPTLLVLDNFEHVQDAAPTVAELLEASPRIRVLATSRTPLNVTGERLLPIEPLAANGAGSTPPALALFYDRAAGYGVTLPTSGPERDAAEKIVSRLDGLPLAIELVAARTRLVGIEELEHMLSESLDAMGSAGADMPERQRTIRSTIEWSLDNLNSRQRRLFDRLSIFPAGASLQQLQAIDQEPSAAAMLENVGALVDNSLVNVITDQPGPTRYRQLVLMRDYGLERLTAADGLDEAMGRLVDHYVSVSADLGYRLRFFGGTEKEISADHANLVAAMNWSIEGGRVEDMTRVLADIWVYWFNGDRVKDGIGWVSRATELVGGPRIEWLAGLMALQTGDLAGAGAKFDAARSGFEQAGEVEWVARVDAFRAFVAEVPDDGRRAAESAVEYFSKGEPGVDLFMARIMLSAYYMMAGDTQAAVELRRELADWADGVDYSTMIGWAHWNLALALFLSGDIAGAEHHNLISFEQMVADGYQEGIASGAHVHASILMNRGAHADGVKLLGAAERVYATIGSAAWPEAVMAAEPGLQAVAGELGDAEVARLRSDGAQLSLPEIVELIRETASG